MKILVLSNTVPCTTRMPGSPRLFNLCREAAEDNELILAFFRGDDDERYRSFMEDPDNNGVFSAFYELSPPEQLGLAGAPNFFRRQLHRISLQCCFSERMRRPAYVRAIREEINAIVAEHTPDLILADGHTIWQYADSRLPIPVIIDLCDCLAFLFAQQSRLEHRLRRKAALALESYAVSRWERAAAARADLIMVISENDKQHLSRFASLAEILVVPNGIDIGFFVRDAGPDSEFKPRLVFTGVMGYGPNADAALHFVEDIFPIIRQRFPRAEFWIVGAAPPPAIKKLGAQDGVFVTGQVADIREQLAAADAFVCPLRCGTGMKNKILAALAMEVPVIATRLSLIGLETEAGVHLLAADSAEEFVDALSLLNEKPAEAEELRLRGRRLVVDRCSWKLPGKALSDAFKRCAYRGKSRAPLGAAWEEEKTLA